MVRIRNSVLSLDLFNEIKKKKKRKRHNGILLIRERGKSFGDESNENLEKHTTNKLKLINKKQFFHEGYRVRV